MQQQIPIVILEDDIFFGKMVQKFLENNDYKNTKLYHQERVCIESIPTNKPILVILDHNLEYSTGLDVMKEIKLKNPNAVFIYLSGQEYCHIALKAIHSGAVDYIEKDNKSFFNLKRLIDRICKESNNLRNTLSMKEFKLKIGFQGN